MAHNCKVIADAIGAGTFAPDFYDRREVILLAHRLPIVAITALGLIAPLALGACQPTVRVEAPKEPITINLNIKLDADVRVRLEEQAEKDVTTNPIF